MKLVTSIEQLDEYLADREPSELIENAGAILKLIEGDHLYVDGQEDSAFVVQENDRVHDDGETYYIPVAWDLVDWYLACDTDSEDMTDDEIAEFKKLGGEIRG